MNRVEYPVLEMFTSIQGEGFHMGKGCTFIRLGGCNLRCSWCDTKHSFDLAKARWLSAGQIVHEFPMPHQHVVITGGEPTLYDLGPLVHELHQQGKYVAIETNGTHSIPEEWGIDWVTASPKPGSGYALNCRSDELKYVVDDEFSVEDITEQKVPEGRIYLQVESGRAESVRKAMELIARYPERDLRIGVQLHKILNVE